MSIPETALQRAGDEPADLSDQFLEAGDQLTRHEFERYEAMPWLKKAELIEGEVYMPSPVRWKQHARPHANFIWWLGHYHAHTPGVELDAEGSIRLDMENEPQPDAAMIIEPACGGQVTLDADDYVAGAPELVGEIAASSEGIDLHKKLRVYRRNQVKEYIVWRVRDRAVDWFVEREGRFERLPLSPARHYQSQVASRDNAQPRAAVRRGGAFRLRSLAAV